MNPIKKKWLLVGVLAATAITIAAPSPATAQSNPFSGVFSGVLRQFQGIGLGIVRSAIANPVGTFRLLNQRVFNIDGTERYLQYYDRYGQYLRYVPGIGGQTIPASVLLDTVAGEIGLENGIPRDLNSILDEILGPRREDDNGENCPSSIPSCSDTTFADLLDEVQRNAVIASTGALGIPDPTIIQAAITESGRRGLSTDKLIANPVVSATFAGNEAARQGVNARVQSRLSEQGQQDALDRIEALDAALMGVNETATEGVQSRITQDIVRALLSVETQKAGFLAMQTMQAEQMGIDNALILNQLRNSGQTQDAIRRQRDTRLNAEASRLIHLTRRRIRF